MQEEFVPTTVNVDKRKYDKMEADLEKLIAFLKKGSQEMMITESNLQCWDVQRTYTVICDQKLIDFIKCNVTYDIAKEQEKKYSQINYNLNTDLDRVVRENDRLVYTIRELESNVKCCRRIIQGLKDERDSNDAITFWQWVFGTKKKIYPERSRVIANETGRTDRYSLRDL